MKLFAAVPEWNNQLRFDEQTEVFTDALAGHLEVATKLIQGLPVVSEELIQEGTATRVGKGFEDRIHGSIYATK